MRRSVLAALAAVLLAGCSQAPPSDPAPTLTPSPTPCVEPPELEEAVDAVAKAAVFPQGATVYGEEGGRANNLREHLEREALAAMVNPKGEGVIVSTVYAGSGAGFRSTAKRTGWLVLDDALYPINVEAAAAFGLLWDGYPPNVMTRAGLAPDDYFGFDSYGIDEFVAYNDDTRSEYRDFVVAANQRCGELSVWG